MRYTYTVEEIFQDIEGDDEFCLMVIPEEICALAGFKEGDRISIEVLDQQLIIKRIGDNNE